MPAAYSKLLGLSPVPDVWEVARQSSGDDEQRIDPDVIAFASVTRRKALGGNRDAAQPIFIEGPGSRLDAIPLLDLDEGQHPATADNQVDFTARNTCPAGEDSPAMQHEPPGGDHLRPAAARFGKLAVQSRPPSSSARA
jgi:hypothetical protein